jgi:hypothetical protein
VPSVISFISLIKATIRPFKPDVRKSDLVERGVIALAFMMGLALFVAIAKFNQICTGSW